MILFLLSILFAADDPISNDEILALTLAFEDLNTEPELSNYMYLDTSDVSKITSIKSGLMTVFAQHGNVHAGDTYIPQHITSILSICQKISRLCSLEAQAYAAQNLPQLSEKIVNIIGENKDTLSDYKYENTAKSVSEIQGIVSAQFARSSREIRGYAAGKGTLVWAYTLVFATNIINDPVFSETSKQSIVRLLIDQSIEGMLTQGGCIQGFVNRGFIALLNILSYYG